MNHKAISTLAGTPKFSGSHRNFPDRSVHAIPTVGREELSTSPLASRLKSLEPAYRLGLEAGGTRNIANNRPFGSGLVETAPNWGNTIPWPHSPSIRADLYSGSW